MTAGRRDQLITIERGAPSQDGYGEETLSWTTYTTEWAAVLYGRGDERRQAAAMQGEQPAVFQVLANDLTLAVAVKDRITLGGGVWNILGIAPHTPDRGHIEFTALRAQ